MMSEIELIVPVKRGELATQVASLRYGNSPAQLVQVVESPEQVTHGNEQTNHFLRKKL